MTVDLLIAQLMAIKAGGGGSLRVLARNPAGDSDLADRAVVRLDHSKCRVVSIERDCDGDDHNSEAIAMSASAAESIGRRFYPDAHVREVPAGHSRRYQIEGTQGTAVRKLSSHLHLSPESAWKDAERKTISMYRELLDGERKDT